MSLFPLDYLSHIRDEILYINGQVAQTSLNEFLGDPTLQRAFARSLEIIGEATKRLPPEFREKYPDIPWKNMAGMRDVLIHQYLGVNYRVVWEVVSEQVPELKVQIGSVMEQERSKS